MDHSVTVACPPALRTFAPSAVRLADDSVFARARDQMLHLARVYPVDRLLAVFRANAGLDTRGAEAPGTWEEFGHPHEDAWGEHDYPGRENAQTASLLRGHYAGHFLSMLAHAYAGEQDEALRAKVDEFVTGLGEVQQALAATGRYSHPGFLAASGEWQFSRLEDFAPYGEIWAPYYTTHKIMAGLLDAHELAGSAEALRIVTAMGHWVAHRLTRLDRARLQQMWSLYIAGEFGGMNETMARLSVAAAEPRFLEVAALFDQDVILDAGVAGVDILTDMHANQHLPQLVGYVREYELTGERRYLDAALGMWDRIVPGRIYAHGGTGESELWGPPETVAGDIGHRNAETCATYNLLKLALRLFAHTRDPRFMAYYERAQLNHILASRRDVTSDTSPEVTYMFPVHPGAVPEFDNVGTCCGGTGLENHVTYQDAVFLTDAEDDLWINLLVPATLQWQARAATVAIDSGHPFDGSARVRLDGLDDTELTLRVRIPAWAAGPVTARVGDEPIAVDAAAGEYLVIRRRWHDGDVLHLHVPAALRGIATPDDVGLLSLEYGPSVLVARSDATTTLELALARRRRVDGGLEADGAVPVDRALADDGGVEVDGVRFEPVWTGSDRRYHLYVRSTAETIGFVGADTAVPARRRDDGTTLLDDVWAAPTPADRTAFLDRVGQAAVAARYSGLLTQDELATVLTAAGRARVGDAPASVDVVVAAGAGEAAGWEIDGTTLRWTVPARLALAPTRPAVAIRSDTAPGPSGWLTETPTVVVVADDLAATGRVEVEVAIDDAPWRAYTGPFALTEPGVHTVAARVTDAAGSRGHAARSFAVDIAPPRSRAVVKRLGSSVEITFHAVDDVSGVDRIQWQGDGTFWATFQEAFVRALGDRAQVIEFAATDRAGNEEPRRRLVLPAVGDDPVDAPAVTWT